MDADRPKPLVLVFSLARDGAFGRAGAYPWQIPEDERRLRSITWTGPVIMGRAAWEGLASALPGRRNIVLSRQSGYVAEGAEVRAYLDFVLHDFWRSFTVPYVIGGAELLRATLPMATRIYLTDIDRTVDADTFFHFDRSGWEVLKSEPAKEHPDVTFLTLERARPPGLRESTAFCHLSKTEKLEGPWYRDVMQHPLGVKAHGGTDPIIRIRIREMQPGETSPYWAWWDKKDLKFHFVFPHRGMVTMCFPYDARAYEDRGEGLLLQVVITEEPESAA